MKIKGVSIMSDEKNKIVKFKRKYNNLIFQNKTIESCITNDKIEILIGLNLIPLITPEFLSNLSLLRQQIEDTWGVILPPSRIRDWTGLAPFEYLIQIQSAPVIKYKFITGRIAVIKGGTTNIEKQIDCIVNHDPLFKFKVLWIKAKDKEFAENCGCKIISHKSIILSHYNISITKHLSSLISFDDVHDLIEIIKDKNPILIDELKNAQISITYITRIIKILISNKIPVSNLAEILKCIIDASMDKKKDIAHVSQVLLAKLAERKKSILFPIVH